MLKPSFRTRSRKAAGHIGQDEASAKPPATESDGQGVGSSNVEDEMKAKVAGEKSPYGDGNKLSYVELFLPDGRLVRQCRATFTCPKRFTFEARRDRMVEHLKLHGLNVEIPIRKGGRPVNEESRNLSGILPNPNKVASQKQAKKRFYEEKRKEKTNVSTQERRLRARAKNLWNASGHKADELTEEEFIVDYVKHEMVKYMSKKAARLRLIQQTIKEGYEAHKRARKVPDWAEVFMNEFDEEELDEDADACESHVVEDGPPSDGASVEVEDAFPSMADLNIGDDIEGLKSKGKKKLPIKRPDKGSVSSPIHVASPLDYEEDDVNQYAFIVSNGNIFLQFTKRDVNTKDGRALARLESGSRILFSSPLSSLVAEIDTHMLNAILESEASTKTMNAFGLWMEHTLPSHVACKVRVIESLWFDMVHNARTKSHTAKSLDRLFAEIDISNLVFVFFPILHRGHWSLFVLYVNKNRRIPGLLGKKSYLLYFDSMGLTDPFECMGAMEGALLKLSKSASDPAVSHTLGSPSTELIFERKIYGIDI